MIRFEFSKRNGDTVRLIRQNLSNADRDLVRQVASTLLPRLKQAAPISKPDYFGRNNPGTLKRSLHFRSSGKTMELWGADYGLYVIGGTRPHIIAARRKPFLVFWWDKTRRVMYLKRVKHPGTQPNDFRQTALEEADADIRSYLRQLAERIAGMMRT